PFNNVFGWNSPSAKSAKTFFKSHAASSRLTFTPEDVCPSCLNDRNFIQYQLLIYILLHIITIFTNKSQINTHYFQKIQYSLTFYKCYFKYVNLRHNHSIGPYL